MDITLIAVPYCLGPSDWGDGLGPQRLLDAGLTRTLSTRGHHTRVSTIDVPELAENEVGASFDLIRATAEQVREEACAGALPIVLAGNCGTASLGALSGLTPREVGVVWLDAHGDFNTPETSPSGYFDGMPLAIAVGDCWRALRETVPGFRPVPTERVLLIGGRDFDAEERARIEDSAIMVVTPEDVHGKGPAEALAESLARLRDRVDAVYLHVDFDVLDPSEGRANALAVPGGLSLDEVKAVIRAVGARLAISAAGLTCYDPTLDAEGRVAAAGRQIAGEIVQAALPA